MHEPPQIVIGVDDPTAADVSVLLRAHLDLAHEVTPPGHVHALDGEGLQADRITLFGARQADGTLVGVGALRDLGGGHYEIKSMHTAAAHRGNGYGRAVLEHLVSAVRDRGGIRVSLETGTMDAFAAARAMYERHGFEVCEPFGEYQRVPNSVCMTLYLS